jgi:hypothetical protein
MPKNLLKLMDTQILKSDATDHTIKVFSFIYVTSPFQSLKILYAECVTLLNHEKTNLFILTNRRDVYHNNSDMRS